MKKILLILFASLCFASAQATDCSDRYFIEEHLALSTCHNHHRGSDAAAIYYDGVVSALSDYIALKIEKGELQNKMFHISMYDPILSQPHYHFSQNKKGYYIMFSGFRGLEDLMRLVDKFAEPNFIYLDLNPYDYEENESDTEEERDRRLENRLNNFQTFEKKMFSKDIDSTDLNKVLEKEYITWQRNKMKFVYTQGKVKCLIGDAEIEENSIAYPSLVRDRYIVQECGYFKVYDETAKLIAIKKNSDDTTYCEYPFNAETYDKWVNFDLYHTIYSYSYDKNKFYEIEKKD